jgi:hypothetical protein
LRYTNTDGYENALASTQEIEGVEYVKALSQHIHAQINATMEMSTTITDLLAEHKNEYLSNTS